VTPSGAVDELVDELADERDPLPKSSAAVQSKAVTISKIRFHMMERLIVSMERKSTTSVLNLHA
jgi:hypothetical protein